MIPSESAVLSSWMKLVSNGHHIVETERHLVLFHPNNAPECRNPSTVFEAAGDASQNYLYYVNDLLKQLKRLIISSLKMEQSKLWKLRSRAVPCNYLV
ncbi:hypothetical protein JRQ81_001110 [Phrynocephalus forsythii]|uniref:Uncharacterized protein n=1 Tax=Phrynocephalus forsythii TaxID=171643 RepID=A0A9Q0Y6K0_9SAUR|nr:hypothetical protein JRQ81_001110 [Phrynocephalus forsythii]